MTLPVVLNIAPHEKRQAEKLIRYIKELDGTEVITMKFDDPPGMRYPEVANWAFRQCAKAMSGKPFIWIEADSIPLKAGWAKTLTEEYEKVGKPYLYVKTLNPPFDNFTGIGVQGPDSYEQAPEGFKDGGFDEWLVRNYGELIGRTDLIQHSYGFYDGKGDATLHEFPRDLSLIRSDAVLFHKDQKQGLIDHLMPSLKSDDVTNVSTVGDAGDAILCLATLKHRGGSYDYYLRDNGATKGIVARAHIVKPLFEAQPYINSVRIWKREEIQWASEGFRPGWHDRTFTLAGAHASHAMSVGFIKEMPDFSKPWLTVEPDKKFSDRVIINRSPRYNNDSFQWGQVVKFYGDRLVFLGLPDEYAAFCRAFGNVQYLVTENMLEAAKAIAGSKLFIGNQSACMTIAEGLKHPRIQEGSLWCCDCVYPSANNAQYVFDGSMTLPSFDGGESLVVESQLMGWKNYILNEVPNCGRGRYGWYYQHNDVMICEGAFEFAWKKVRKMTQWADEVCQKAVVDFTVALNPQWFERKVKLPQLDVARRALRNAGYTEHPIL